MHAGAQAKRGHRTHRRRQDRPRGIRQEPAGRWRISAPYGLSDVFNLIVRPNPVLAPRHVYQARTKRWRRQWPELTILPWAEEPAAPYPHKRAENR